MTKQHNIYIDEAGRGPLAGPVWVGVVMPLTQFDLSPFADSKQLTEKQREICYDQILLLAEKGKIAFASSYSRASTIDRLGIIRAQRQAMKVACQQLHNAGDHGTTLVIDGNHTFGMDRWYSVETIIKGDQKVPYISMASIIAKVERDRYMVRQAKKFPVYGFERHKGYGTTFHREAICNYGLNNIHRKSFCTSLV